MERFEEKREELVKIIEALQGLEKSEEWATLRELVFDKELDSIERQLLNASKEMPLDTAKLYKLQGELFQARKYELNSFIENLKKQLENINKQIK